MGHPTGRKEEGRARVLAGAGRGFRRHGAGVGVDAMAKEAGVTSGAFYAHFKSKAAAFRAVVEDGLGTVRTLVERLRAEREDDWATALAEVYLTEKRICEPGEACALQSLTADVARADEEVRMAYGVALEGILSEMTGPSATGEARQKAIALLALLSGGVSLARAVGDPHLSDEIASAVRTAAARLGPP